jgi:hypothetical protein
MKGVNHFRVKGKLAPRYIGPFQILKQCGNVAYHLRLPEQLSAVHNVFYVSQLKKCLRVPDQVTDFEGVKLELDLTYSEYPIWVLDQKDHALGENKRKLQVKSQHHLWDDSYLYRVCSDGLLMRCVSIAEGLQITERCHAVPYGGHYRVFYTQAKIWQCAFFWPTMYEDTKEFIWRCRKFQFQGSINSRNAMPLHYNLQI